MSPRQFRWNGFRVPYTAPWSSEQQLPGTIVQRRGHGGVGIGFADEYSRVDRRKDALWVRMPLLRGKGRPNLAGVHPLRQRHAMDYMLCQVCGESTDDCRSDKRHLFLVRAETGQPITEGERTATPPVHESCAVEALRDCPHLRKGATASLVEFAPTWGVAGIVYDRRTLQPLPSDDKDGLTFVGHDDPAIRWTLAAREVVTLEGCTTVDLDDLVAQFAAA